MSNSENTQGWLGFNTSSEEYEWSIGRLHECDGYKKVRKCTWEEFCKEFPGYD